LAQVIYSANALANLERAFEFLVGHEATAAADAAASIQEAVNMLADHPLIGRPVEGDIRELVISFGRTGYVALYRFLPGWSQVRILAIRHQRELDYPA
jgi:plasmid stabilization system protein ParE